MNRKEPEATVKTCKADVKEIPCGVECSMINFFPAESGRLPRIGKWNEIALVFFLNNVAEGMSLEAPEGFDIGRMAATKEQPYELCLLKDHNIPRLKRCRVDATKNGRVRATFDLYNALEPKFTTAEYGTYQPQYEIRFYVKTPATCEGGFNSRGACKTAPGAWDWTLHTWNNEDNGYSLEHERAGFEVYNDHAREWHQVEHVQRPVEEETAFLSGKLDEAEMAGTTDDDPPVKVP